MRVRHLSGSLVLRNLSRIAWQNAGLVGSPHQISNLRIGRRVQLKGVNIISELGLGKKCMT